MITDEVFATGMAAIGLAVGGREVSRAMFDEYAYGLRELTDAEFLAAVRVARQRCTFFPAVAELRAFALGERREQARRALADLRAGVAVYGAPQMRPAEFDRALDPPTRAGISAAGGIAAIWNATEQQRSTLEQLFADGYIHALQQTPLAAGRPVAALTAGAP